MPLSPDTAPTTTAVRLAQGASILLSALASGVSLSLSALLVPRLLESPTPLMLRQWAHTDRRLVAAVSPAAAGSYLWLASSRRGRGAGWWYLAAGLLTAGVVPYALVVMAGTNRRLRALAERVAADADVDVDVAAKEGDGGGVEVEVGAEAEAEGEVKGEKGPKYWVDWWGVLNLGRTAMLVAGSVCGLVATL